MPIEDKIDKTPYPLKPQIWFWSLFTFLLWSLYFIPKANMVGYLPVISSYAIFILGISIVFYGNLYLVMPLYNKWENTGLKILLFFTTTIMSIIISTLAKDLAAAIVFKHYSLLGSQHIYESYHSVTWVLIASAGIYFLSRWQNNKRIISELNHEIDESKLQFHIAQMNPHFLFNVLNSLYAVALTTPEKAEALIEKIHDLMQYSFRQMNQDVVPLSEELHFIKNYIALQQTRLGTLSTIHVQYPPDISSIKSGIQPLILISFVENIFKHAEINNQENPVSISIEITDNSLVYKSSNGIKEASNLSKNGIGLENVKSRLQLRYPNTSSLNIDHKATHYSIQAIIPLEELSDEQKETFNV